MAVNSVDFITLIKDIRGNQFDPATGLPTNGKWFDIKGWHTTVGANATQVALDLVDTTAAKVAAAASVSTATTKASDAALSAVNAAASLVSAQAVEQATSVSAVAASASATAANASANTATAKATESASSAVLAANSVTAAGTSATASATSATASATSATAAAASATSADGSKNAAVTSEGNALSYSNAANTSATSSINAASAAATSANTATTQAAAATTQRNLAANWAIAAEDLAVNDGVNPSGFSAYHWAKKAQSAVGGVQNIGDLGDVPALTGNANRYLRVNATATAVEYDTLTKEDVGLSLINNTSDVDKPVSSATQTALNAKSSQTEMNTTVTRVTTLEGNTAGLSVLAASGSDPVRLRADKAIYTAATQVLATLQNAELTTFALLKAALAAETIGTY